MPLVSALNLSREDRLDDLERAIREALSSLPEMKINDDEVMLAPVLKPDGFHGTVSRVNVDLWERRDLTKDALQELATRVAGAFKGVVGRERRVIVVIRPYDPAAAGWVSA